MPVLGVSRDTYQRLRRIRDALGLRSLEAALILLLDMYEDSVTNLNEAVISLLANVRRIGERLESIERKLEELSLGAVPQGPQPMVHQPPQVEIEGDVPDWVRDNPWIGVIATRKEGGEKKL